MNPEIISTTTEEYKELIESLKKDGFEMMVDLTVVDLSLIHISEPTRPY